MVYLPHWPIPSTLGKVQIDYETVFERMSPVLEKLGNPHKKLPPVIHVAGTNGKGSTASLLTKIFSCAGYKAHLYTSPHLHDCNERLVLNGDKISDSFLFEIMEEVRIAADNVSLTFMEAFTLGVFLAFAKVPADIVIIECGMGGRIDATNIIEKKIATIITPISYDHTEYLGNSIERIALEKAMIMRPQASLIVASQPKKALEIIDLLAKDQKIPTYYFDHDFAVLLDEETGQFDLEFFGKNQNLYLEKIPKPALAGEHQYINFGTAIAAILAIKEQDPNLFKIDDNHIKQAVSDIYWPNRLEKIDNSLNEILRNENSELWIDGAHNEAGAFSLARWLLSKKSEDITPKKTFVIVGFSKGKCKSSFLDKFSNIAEEIIAVRVDGEPYPEESEIIYEMIKKVGINGFAADDLLDAIEHIAKSNNFNDCRIVICGSLHLARDVKKFSTLSK
jgi:dihydrofolate synthase / folylpolyglutamate synthase